jgi:hydrogenase expression/formation protein HypD
MQEQKAAEELLAAIGHLVTRPIRLMEVCGTHTVAIFRAGLRQLLPAGIELVSGPGCPVCVTPDSYMDKAIAYAKSEDVIIATFGDMLKVPGSSSSLGEAQAEGADIRVVYSSLDSLQIAAENPDKMVIFLAVGFETTAPTAAATVLAARQQGLTNFTMLSAHKLVPPVMRRLLQDNRARVDGFLLPGHVCVVTGTEVFRFLPAEYQMAGVVAGFEPLQLLRAIYRLTAQIVAGQPRIENEYGSVVRPEGNPAARHIMAAVYGTAAADWRGMGIIPQSGLKMREEFAAFDIEQQRPLHLPKVAKKTACRCGEVLQGIIQPKECPLFGRTCVPTHAQGPCMVSVEGICAAWYKYGRSTFTFD